MPKNLEISDSRLHGVNEGGGHKPAESDGVSVERQIALAKKYGVSAELIEKLTNEPASSAERNQALEQMVKILANAIIHTEVDPNDVEDVSAMVPARFGVSKADYAPFYIIKHGI